MADFCDAAHRHWEDANHLLDENRIANADHLFGLSAECSLKAVMQGLGMTLLVDGRPEERKNRVHANEIWDEFVTFAEDREGARYASIISGFPNPFNDWNINQRYCHRSGITLPTVEGSRKGAEKAQSVLDAAILDGVVQ